MTKIVEGLWLSYRRQVLPPDAEDIHVSECKRAFYAGARGIISTIMTSLSDGDDINEDDEQILTSIEEELGSFKNDVIGGRA